MEAALLPEPHFLVRLHFRASLQLVQISPSMPLFTEVRGIGILRSSAGIEFS
jgi:hypothetical protein